MAFNYRASTIVCDAGPNTIPGPIWIKGIVISTGSVSIANASGTIEILQAGVYDNLSMRSTKSLIITGACTIHLKVR